MVRKKKKNKQSMTLYSARNDGQMNWDLMQSHLISFRAEMWKTDVSNVAEMKKKEKISWPKSQVAKRNSPIMMRLGWLLLSINL